MLEYFDTETHYLRTCTRTGSIMRTQVLHIIVHQFFRENAGVFFVRNKEMFLPLAFYVLFKLCYRFYIFICLINICNKFFNNNNNNNDLLSTVSHHKKFTKQNKYNICDKRNRTKPKLIFKP